MNNTTIFILGGRSQITPFMLEKLRLKGLGATVASRKGIKVPTGFKALSLDIRNPNGWKAPSGAIIISLLPIWILSDHLDLFTEAKNIIIISSTSRYGKATSKNKIEQQIVKNITQSEQRIQEWTTPQGPSTTILRPTLIYDCKTDKNITRIIRMIERFGFFPILSPTNGKRQPIHADDVAEAIMRAINNKDAMNRAFNIAGGEIITYHEMLIRIFKKCGKKPRLLVLPYWFIKLTMTFFTATRFIHKSDLNADMFLRMNEDLIFDNEEGFKVLGYEPKKFLKDDYSRFR